jgi:hypothetical protein
MPDSAATRVPGVTAFAGNPQGAQHGTINCAGIVQAVEVQETSLE